MNLKFENAYQLYIDYVNLKQKPTSVIALKRKFEFLILPYFKNKKIKKISNLDYLDWQNKIEKKGYSYGYKRNLHYCMTAFYDFLISYHKVKNNIPRLVGNFKNNDIKKNKIKTWSIEEFRNFINVVDDPIYKTLFLFLFLTGCRKSEALALNFNDINNNIITINKSITKDLINGERLILPPKTKKSIRNILIDDKLNDQIKKLQEYYNTKYNNFNKNFFIFGGIKPIPCTTLERKMSLYCTKSNVKKIRVHDLRHSHATLLFENNISIATISKRLGHCSIKTTLDYYVHAEEQEKKAVDLLNSLI